jgi:Divergent InlB B-repeat domain
VPRSRESAAAAIASGESAVAVGGDVVDSVIVTAPNSRVVVLRLGDPAGALLGFLRLRRTPKKKARRVPLVRRPARFADHVDREDESAALVAASRPVNLYGAAGVGKTYVVADALSRDDALELPDGVIYAFAKAMPLDDVLQVLFEEFYDCRPPFRPSAEQIGRDLANKRALIVVDSVELERDEVQRLLAAAPQSRFVVVSRERTLWDGDPLLLKGLPTEAALAIVEQEVGRALDAEERHAAARVCAALSGDPLAIRQAVAVVREDGRTLEDVADRFERSSSEDLIKLIVEPLTTQQRAILEALAPFGDAAVGVEHLVSLAKVEAVRLSLDALERRNIVQTHSPRYSVVANVAAVQPTSLEAIDRALEHFADWAEKHRDKLGEQLEEAPALLELVRRASSLGREKGAIRLAMAIDAAFAQGRRLGAWAEVHEVALEAARRIGDKAGEAWALHQRGTRRVVSGRAADGIDDLEAALVLRRQLGDAPGVAATEWNLGAVSRLRAAGGGPLAAVLRLPFVTLAVILIALMFAGGAGTAIWYATHGGHHNQHPQTGPSTTSVDRVALSVTKRGRGDGSVTSKPIGINCGARCTSTFEVGQAITLHAAAKAGSHFVGWSGRCARSLVCKLRMHSDAHVSARFVPLATTPVMSVRVRGSGSVGSVPAGIDCGSHCAKAFALHTVVTLTATSARGFRFTAWSGTNCSGAARTCRLTVLKAISVTASFAALRRRYSLTLKRSGDGSGVVSSRPAGIDCGDRCSARFASGRAVTLTARAGDGSVFKGWSGGGCAGTNQCSVTMDRWRTVIATFGVATTTYTLDVGSRGSGTGSVTSAPSGIDCGKTCKASFSANTSITLTATADPGSVFAGWSESSCGTAATCPLALDHDLSVTATFNAAPKHRLTIVEMGLGSGTVTSSPSGAMNCPTSCKASFAEHASVTLTATANPGSLFAGWSVTSCGTSATCTVTLDHDVSLTASFELQTQQLIVGVKGSGTITSSPVGINCAASCQAPFPKGTTITLTAKPVGNSAFVNWAGACSGTINPCKLKLDSDLRVYAVFAPLVNVAVLNSGGGIVTSIPLGITCPTTCSRQFTSGTTVTLTATANAKYAFNGWGGACKGKPDPCVLTITASIRVSVSFIAVPG